MNNNKKEELNYHNLNEVIGLSKKMLKTLILKENESLYHHLKNMFLKVVISIIIVLSYDLFLYFLANPILNLFSFLIK